MVLACEQFLGLLPVEGRHASLLCGSLVLFVFHLLLFAHSRRLLRHRLLIRVEVLDRLLELGKRLRLEPAPVNETLRVVVSVLLVLVP